MIRIMFVCHGNICRSPMAEFIMKDLIKEYGLEDYFEIASAATSSEEIWNGRGNPVYPPAREVLNRHGISCEGKRAQQLHHSDYDKWDYFIGMDHQNMMNMQRILGHSNKSSLLLSYINKDRGISDPWYTGDFETAFEDVHEGCVGLLQYIVERRLIGEKKQ